jgi:aspartyl-tRNA(Asn)/glutamyl-tRNA(Gln) amidotransferase subunit C
MSLTKQEVEHIARLARVGVTDEDVERFQRQLSVILDSFEQLRGLDTEGVEPTAHTLPLRNVERQDLPRLSFPREAMLANAPRVQDGFVRVRKVLE